MNPANWKREHQVALGVAMLVGAALGILALYLSTQPPGGYLSLWLWRRDWAELFVWPAIGALLGGGVVYVRQLLRQ